MLTIDIIKRKRKDSGEIKYQLALEHVERALRIYEDKSKVSEDDTVVREWCVRLKIQLKQNLFPFLQAGKETSITKPNAIYLRNSKV